MFTLFGAAAAAGSQGSAGICRECSTEVIHTIRNGKRSSYPRINVQLNHGECSGLAWSWS